MRNHLKNRKNSGFTLVEMALVLVIAGLLLSLSASVGSARIEAQKIKDTNARMSYIMDGIKQYVRNYNHLPCPASPTAVESDNTFGYGAGTNTDPANCNATSITETGGVSIGYIPVRELGLSTAVVTDGWGNKIFYAVTENLTMIQKDSVTAEDDRGYGDADPSNQGSITVKTAASGGTTITTTAAVLIMSLGPGNSYTEDDDEAENGGNPTTPVLDGTFVQKFPTSTFDDIVIYAEKWQLPYVEED